MSARVHSFPGESLLLAWGNKVVFVQWTACCALAKLFWVISGSSEIIPLSLLPLHACISPAAWANCAWFCILIMLLYFSLLFLFCFVATQLARQLQLERLQVMCSNKEAQKRLARKQSRNGPRIWRQTHIHVVKQNRNIVNYTSRNNEHDWKAHLWNNNQLLRHHGGTALFKSMGNGFVQGKIWDHRSKRTQKRPKNWGGVILWYK